MSLKGMCPLIQYKVYRNDFVIISYLLGRKETIKICIGLAMCIMECIMRI